MKKIFVLIFIVSILTASVYAETYSTSASLFFYNYWVRTNMSVHVVDLPRYSGYTLKGRMINEPDDSMVQAVAPYKNPEDNVLYFELYMYNSTTDEKMILPEKADMYMNTGCMPNNMGETCVDINLVRILDFSE